MAARSTYKVRANVQTLSFNPGEFFYIDAERGWKLANAGKVRTPLLMLQGEADLRCSMHDNVQLFTALRVLGRTVEFILYPDEYHVYFTAGRPDRRIDHMTRMLDWFDRYVKA